MIILYFVAVIPFKSLFQILKKVLLSKSMSFEVVLNASQFQVTQLF